MIDEHAIFIGHSLGAAFALRWLEKNAQKIHACFLVAPAWKVTGIIFDPLMITFTKAPYDWATLGTRCGKYVVIHGEHDPYIQHPMSENLAENLKASLVVIHRGRHLNERAGFTRFEELRDLVLLALNS